MINTKDTKKKKNYNYFCYFGCDKLQLVYYHFYISLPIILLLVTPIITCYSNCEKNYEIFFFKLSCVKKKISYLHQEPKILRFFIYYKMATC